MLGDHLRQGESAARSPKFFHVITLPFGNILMAPEITDPADYRRCIMGRAIASGWHGPPVFKAPGGPLLAVEHDR